MVENKGIQCYILTLSLQNGERIVARTMKANPQASKPRAKKVPAKRRTMAEGSIRAAKKPAALSAFESLLVDISTRFISLPGDRLDSEILLAQRQVCECLGLDVSSLWQSDLEHPGSLTATHVYVPPDFPVPVLKMDAKDTFPWSMVRIFKGETVVLSHMTNLPAAAARDLELFRYYRIQSSVAFPLSTGGSPVFGCLAFNTYRRQLTWSTELIDKLRLVVQIFANAVAHKRADQALQESEARFRGIFEGSIEGIYRSSSDGKVLVANPAMAKMLGYDSAEAAILDIMDLGQQVWRDPEERSRFTRQLEEQGTIRGYECQFRRKDGTKIWVSLNSRSVFGSDGRIAYYETFAADITERKHAEEALEKSRSLIAEIERIGRVGAWEIDLDTRKVTWTPEIYSIHEVDPAFEPTVEAANQFYAPASRPVIERLVRRAIEHAEPYDVELEIITAKGNLRSVHSIGRADLEHRRVYGFFQDITASKQHEREMAQLRLELNHLTRVLTLNEISGSLAHEINQPLGAILNNAEAARVLLSQAQDKLEEIPEIVEDIIQDAKRAGDVVRNVRGLVKKSDANVESLHINTLIDDVLALLHNTIAMNNVALHLDLKPDLPNVRGERVNLQQVLLNLVMNALDAMKESPSRILTVRSAMNTPDMVTVSVSDTGPGITEAQRALVFQPFFTTKKEGLGLGLAICRSIIEEHRGWIWEDDNPAGGATFSFSLRAPTERSA